MGKIIDKIKDWLKEHFVENKTESDDKNVNISNQNNIQKSLTEGEDYIIETAGTNNNSGFVAKAKVDTKKATKTAAAKNQSKAKTVTTKTIE